MTRKECLDEAAKCVLKDRASQYGGPEDNFGRIAKLWTDYLGLQIDGVDVAMMMALLKIARVRNNKVYWDGFCDLAGYAACGAELAGAEKAREDATRKWGEEYKKLRAETEGDAKAKDCEEPKFKPGDKVQYRVVLPSVSDSLWRSAVYVRYDSGCKRPHVVDKDGELSCVDDNDIRLAPKTESKGVFLDFSERVIDLMKECRIKEVTNFDGSAGFFAKENGTVTGMRFVTDDGKAGCATAPKAEGCEELVQKDLHEDCEGCLYKTYADSHAEEHDAPQTREALFQHIVDCNPATFHAPSYAEEQVEHYGRAHKPTGEELAEMVEEEAHE